MKDNKPRSCELGLQTSTAGNVCSFCKLCGDQLIPLDYLRHWNLLRPLFIHTQNNSRNDRNEALYVCNYE